MKRIVFWSFLILFTVILLEVGGWIGLKLLEKRYSEPAVAELFGEDDEKVTPIRSILKGDKEYTTKYTAAYNLNYILTPGYKAKNIVQHNKDGYRGELVNCKKGAEYRILFLGGSTTYGAAVIHPEETFPAQAKQILLDSIGKHPEIKVHIPGVEVINGGLGAAYSGDELNAYLYKFRYYKPDLVVIHSGGNDAQISLSSNNFVPDYSHIRDPSMFQVRKPPFPTWFLNSNFISFLTISILYPFDENLKSHHPKAVRCILRLGTLMSIKR